MRRISIRLPLLFVVAIITMTMVLGPWGQFVVPAYAEGEGDFGRICFDGDSEYEWAHFYSVDSIEDSLTMDDLNITVLDGDGIPKEEDSYILSVEYLRYDEEEDREVGDPVDPPFGIDNPEEGFTEYRAVATSADDPEVWCEGRFFVMDRHSLAFVCADIGVEPGTATWYERWRMHHRYWFNPGSDINFVVKHTGDNEPLTEGIDYEVKYYRVARPEDMDHDDVLFEDIIVPDPEYLVKDGEGNPVQPTEPGAYFARITGINDYYGENDVLVDIDSIPRIAFRSGGEHELWSDGDLTYDVDIPDGVDGDLWIGVGVRGEDRWEVLFNDEQNPAEFFGYNDQSGELTLHGDAIFEAIGDRGVNIYASITKEGEEDNLLAEGFADADVREAKYEYDLPEDDALLPEWTGWIDNKFHVYIENKQYPEGKDWDLTVTNATLTNVSPEGAFKLEEKDGGWEYRAEKLGRATVNLEYEDIDGTPKEHSFELSCAEHVYHVDMWPVEGINQGLPGTSIELEAYAEHQYVCRDEDNPDEWHHENTQDDLEYNWCFEKNGRFTAFSEFATITPNDKDPSKATLTFKDMPEGWDDIGEQINVAVSITDTKSEDPQRERASHQRDFWVNSDYMQIMPAQIDSNLDVGRSLTIEPELWHYQYGKDGHEVIEADFEIDNVDDNAIDVAETDNGFKITRKGDWDTNFNIKARFRWENRLEERDQWYHLNNREYRIYFPYDNTEIFSDQDLSIDLEKEELEGLNPNNGDYRIEYTVGTWDPEEERWTYEMDPNKYDADSNGITLSGAEIKDANLDGVNVHAELFLKGQNEPIDDTWVWLELRDPCRDEDGDGEADHHWIKATIKEATLTEEGKEVWICLAHSLWEGCGEVRFKSIPKKIDIAKVSVGTIKAVTYNKKAQKPAVTVKYNGTTLTAGTDYNIAYVNNTNAGKATVVLVGKGRFAGDTTATFTINKAANPVKLTAKKPTVKFAALKKKNQVVKQTAACAVSGAQGKVTWKKVSGNAKITVAANGKVTVKKGLKKGTYKVKVNATAAGNANYNKATKAATITIVVK